MALYHKWGVKTGFTFALQFFMLIFDGLGGVLKSYHISWEPYSYNNISKVEEITKVFLGNNGMRIFEAALSNLMGLWGTTKIKQKEATTKTLGHY